MKEGASKRAFLLMKLPLQRGLSSPLPWGIWNRPQQTAEQFHSVMGRGCLVQGRRRGLRAFGEAAGQADGPGLGAGKAEFAARMYIMLMSTSGMFLE